MDIKTSSLKSHLRKVCLFLFLFRHYFNFPSNLNISIVYGIHERRVVICSRTRRYNHQEEKAAVLPAGTAASKEPEYDEESTDGYQGVHAVVQHLRLRPRLSSSHKIE
jgi:hypothetical protein